MERIVLDKIIKSRKTISYSFTVTEGLNNYFSGRVFKIEYPENIELVPDYIACIPFVANVLPIIWLANCELILGELDEAFYNCLPDLKHGYESMFPESKWLGKISVDTIVSCDRCPLDRSAMFFSGGLDSVQTLVSHLDEKPDLISIWGSDIKYDNTDGWNTVYNALKEVADRYSLKSVVIKSTFREFDCEGELQKVFSDQLKDGWWHGVKHGIGLLGHIAPYAYLNNMSTMYIASTNCPEDGAVRCASNPATDNTVRFANCKVAHDGFEFSRQDKIKNTADFCKKRHDYIPLHVCWESQSGNNCCHCEKCYRTMSGLIVEGEDPKNYGFEKADIYMPEIEDFIFSNKCKYVDALQTYWPHIHKKAKENKRIIKDRYYNDIKWIIKADFSDINLLGLSFLEKVKYRLSRHGFYQMLHDKKIKFIEEKEKKSVLKPIYRKLKKNRRGAIYLFTPTHENLGDHAIAYATIELLKKYDFNYIEITDEELYLLNYYHSLNIFNGRKIIFHGGGYLGTIWPACERLTRKIVLANPLSPIFFLPNTIFYENTGEGMAELEKSKQIYNSHKGLVFYARELNSYKYMKRIYKNVRLCPDMVLSICKQDDSIKRNGCLVCLRNDIEKTLNENDAKSIIKQVKMTFDTNYSITDMYSPSYFDISKREEVLENKFQEFRSTQLVITDRLHGMIFSAITGTPCIVIDSKSPKVKGCYEWVKDLSYIRFCDDVSKIHDIIEDLISLNNCKYDASVFSQYFSDLMKEISQ